MPRPNIPGFSIWLIDWLMDGLIRSFFRSFVSSLVRSFVHSFIRSLVHWFIDSLIDQLGRRVQKIQCRDHQLSQSAQHVISLQAQLEQTTENVEQLQLKLDCCREKYDSSTRQSANLQSEMVRLQQLLNSSQQQVIIRAVLNILFVFYSDRIAAQVEYSYLAK